MPSSLSLWDGSEHSVLVLLPLPFSPKYDGDHPISRLRILRVKIYNGSLVAKAVSSLHELQAQQPQERTIASKQAGKRSLTRW